MHFQANKQLPLNNKKQLWTLVCKCTFELWFLLSIHQLNLAKYIFVKGRKGMLRYSVSYTVQYRASLHNIIALIQDVYLDNQWIDLCYDCTSWFMLYSYMLDYSSSCNTRHWQTPDICQTRCKKWQVQGKSTVLIVTLICLWHHQHVALYFIGNLVFKIEIRRCSGNKCLMYEIILRGLRVWMRMR